METPYANVMGCIMYAMRELSAKLEMTKTVEVIARKAIVKGTGLLRKPEMKNDMLQVEIHQLKLDMATTESSKTKFEE
uniref:Uncharacterized protein n=1 Tax=Vitis vinifera TaxID=29760 RepID=F6HT27_VITVI